MSRISLRLNPLLPTFPLVGVMEALSRLCMRLEMHLTHKRGWFEHLNHPDTALLYLLRYIASYVLC
jgi:hypothetical protein